MKETAAIKDYSLSHEQKDFLDTNGYLLLKSRLSLHQLQQIRHRIDAIRKEEGPRWGEYGYSVLRERFKKQGNTTKLYCYDLLFRVFRFVLGTSIRVLPQIRKALSLYTRIPFDRTRASLFQHELRQMLICIVEQYDGKADDRRICDLVNKGKEFDILYQDPLVLDAVQHLIGSDFKLSSLNLRSPNKNNTIQDMHVDYPWAVKGNRYYACNALWMLNDMKPSNGATRIIPGSHKWGKMPYEGMKSVKDPHPDEIVISGEAGDILLVNSHVWHGGTVNVSGEERTVVQAYYVHRGCYPQQFHRFQIYPETKKRLTEEQLDLLDIHN